MATYRENEWKLIRLARKQFADLTPAEEKLFRAVVYPRRPANYTAGNAELDNPQNAGIWGPERRLRSDVLWWLLTYHPAKTLVAHTGVWIEGACVEGDLNLQFADIPFPLRINRSVIKGVLILVNAHLKSLYLNSTHTGPIVADGMDVDGDVNFRDGFSSSGEMHMVGAKIGGRFDLKGARLNSRGALDKHYFLLMTGQLRSPSELAARQARSKALEADRMVVADSLIMGPGFVAEGEVSLKGCNVGGNFDCGGRPPMEIENPGSDSSSRRSGSVDLSRYLGGQFLNCYGTALSLDSARFHGNVVLRYGFRIQGQLRLVGTEIDGKLECDGGTFVAPKQLDERTKREEGDRGPHAILADTMQVRGDMFLREGATIKGRLSLNGASIGNYLVLEDLTGESELRLDLRNAKVGVLWDDPTSWPRKGELQLQGFQYNTLDNRAPHDAKSRIKWLRRQYVYSTPLKRRFYYICRILRITFRFLFRRGSLSRWLWRSFRHSMKRFWFYVRCRPFSVTKRRDQEAFSPQPYEQLAEVLRKQGYQERARKVMIAKEADQWKIGPMRNWWSLPKLDLLCHFIYSATLDYGHRPWRAFRIALGIMVLGGFLFRSAFEQGVLKAAESRGNATATSQDGGKEESDSSLPGENAHRGDGEGGPEEGNKEVPQHPFIYSVDKFVPFVDLGEAKNWAIDEKEEFRILCKLSFSGKCLRYYQCFHVFAGWALTTLLVVGLTRKVRT